MKGKSERLELRIEPETLEIIDAWRARAPDQPSRAEAIRRLIDVGLGREISEPTLRSGDRLTAMMLCDVMRALKTITPKHPWNSGIDPEFVSEAIMDGHLWGLRQRYDRVFESSEPNRSIIAEVYDILDMWADIEWSYARMSGEDKGKLAKRKLTLASRDIRFPGFDGNTESGHRSVAMFLIEHLDSYQDFANRDLNSHRPMLAGYRRMLDKYRESGRERPDFRNLMGEEAIARLLTV